MTVFSTDPATKFAEEVAAITDVACELNGGKVVFATDNFFAAADNMLKVETPIFIATEFTEFGKWMDGWETRRKRTPGHDWCIIKLGGGADISHVEIDTAFFSGNYAPRASLQGAWIEDDTSLPQPSDFNNEIGTIASKDAHEKAEAYNSDTWEHLIERTPMGAGYPETSRNYFTLACQRACTHVRLNIFPDGGVARLRIYGQPKVNWEKHIANKTRMDLAYVINGGTGVGHSNAHYGKASNLTSCGRARTMDEGWETKRKDDRPAILEMGSNGLLVLPGDDWAVVKLGHRGIVNSVLIDTNHFKGNFPESCQVEGCLYEGSDVATLNSKGEFPGAAWMPLVTRCKLAAHEEVEKESICTTPITHLRLTIYPDGGVSRLRAYGVPC